MSSRSNLAQKVASFIERENLFDSNSRLLLAVSSGLDSTVLLHLLVELGYRPQLAHFNYMLRGEESREDVEFLKDLANDLGLELHLDGCTYEESQSLKNDGNLQARARSMRYEFLAKMAEVHTCDCILTAHHADDALETFLINFLRGSGLRGLRGILPRSNGLARPLLETSREELANYAVQNEIIWREDSSNTEDDYLRNQLRHQVITKLHQIKPGLNKIAAQTFDRLRNTYAVYLENIQDYWHKVSRKDGRGWFSLDRRQLTGPNQKKIELALVEMLGTDTFNSEVRRQMREALPGSLLETPDRLIYIGQDRVAIGTKPIEEPAEIRAFDPGRKQNIQIRLDHFTTLSGELVDLGKTVKNDQTTSRHQIIRTPPNFLYLPKDMIAQATIRRPRSGDRFRPFGMGGKSQKLQDYFVNAKIDRLERVHAWLLVDKNDTILWVMGHRAAEETRLPVEDKIVFKLEIKRLSRGQF
ncbi:MAG: tRNA lysidine(34) synthetase TilS [Bacteroidota bacterium]